MKVNIINESGYKEALIGLSLSYNTKFDQEKQHNIAKKLADKNGGHNKFLESIVVWIDINAPRYWWQQFDTYRVGMTKQSESTMHTLLKRQLTYDDFETILPDILNIINFWIEEKNFKVAKQNLPESFLQRRIVCTNYKVLRNIILQRKTHKLKEWQLFINSILKQIKYPELLPIDCENK